MTICELIDKLSHLSPDSEILIELLPEGEDKTISEIKGIAYNFVSGTTTLWRD